MTACESCASGPRLEEVGDEARLSLGLVMPTGSRRVHSELPYAGSSDVLEVVLCPLEPDEAADFFRVEGVTESQPSTFSIGDGWEVRVEPADEIPRSGSGIPLLAALPRDARSIITVHRLGTPGACPPCPEGFTGTTVENCRCP